MHAFKGKFYKTHVQLGMTLPKKNIRRFFSVRLMHDWINQGQRAVIKSLSKLRLCYLFLSTL